MTAMTKNFSGNTILPPRPLSREEMDDDTFNAMLQRGYEEALAGLSRPAEEVFAELFERLKKSEKYERNKERGKL